MKRKANDDAKPKQSASVGFNKLFAKRAKKTTSVSETINLCDDDDEDNKENSVIPKIEQKSQVESKFHQKNEEKSKEEASDDFYIPDVVPEKTEIDHDKSKGTKKESDEFKVDIDVDDLDDSREQEEQTSMVKAFHHILGTIEKNSDKCENMSSPEDLKQIKSLSELELDDLLRWYRRRPGWKLPFKQSFPGNLTKLTCLGFIDKISSKTGMEFSELIQILNRQELETVAKKMLIDKKYRLNMDKLKAKMMEDFQKNTKSHFGSKTPAERLYQAAIKVVDGKRFRLSEEIKESLNELFLIYSPTIISSNQAGDDGQVPGSAQIQNKKKGLTISLGQEFLQNISRFGFNDLLDPEKVVSTINITSNEELKILNKSISYKYKMYSLFEMKKFDETIELGEKVFAEFEKFRETKSDIFARNRSEKSFLRRYTVTGNYMKAIKCLIDAYEKEKRWTKANHMLRFLIGLNFSLHRHGRWWIRIIINSGHLKEKIEKVELTETFEEAIKDRNKTEPEHYEILDRMNKFLKNDTDSKLKGWTEITGTAKRIGMDGDLDMKNGNKMWILDGQIASVENVALAKLKNQCQFDKGIHSESAIFSTILSLYIKDEIQDYSIEGVYQTIFQNGPLDFYTREFFKSRKVILKKKFKDLEEDLETALEAMEKVWNEFEDGGLIGMNYYKNSERGEITWDDLKTFCQCLGGYSLSAILKRLCQTPAHRSGLPDISAWNSNGISGGYCLAEVKAPNDKLSFAQKCWLKFFCDKEIKCQVIYIKEQN